MRTSLIFLLLFSQHLLSAQSTKGIDQQADYAKQFVNSGYKKTAQPDSLPPYIGWTNDFENIYTPRQIKVLDSIIDDFKHETSIEIVVVSIPQSFTSKDSFDNYTLKLGQSWGVGEKVKDNGVLIGISKGFRQMRIQNGKGIEKILTDEETGNIVDNYFIPGFKKGDYFNGTLAGLQELIRILWTRNK